MWNRFRCTGKKLYRENKLMTVLLGLLFNLIYGSWKQHPYFSSKLLWQSLQDQFLCLVSSIHTNTPTKEETNNKNVLLNSGPEFSSSTPHLLFLSVIGTFWRAIFLQIVKFNVQEIAIQYNYHSRYAVSDGTVKPMYTAEHVNNNY